MQSTGFSASQSGLNETGAISHGRKTRATIQTASSSSSQWDNNMLERLRIIIQTSPKTIQQIFNEFDEDGNGFVTNVEFRNAIRRLGLGITSREIDQLMGQIDTNQDGKIDYQEF